MRIYKNYSFLSDLVKFILNDVTLKQYYDFTYYGQKYCLEDILLSILAITKNGITWNDFDAIINDKKRKKVIKMNYVEKYKQHKEYYKNENKNIIIGKTIWTHFNRFCECKIFEKFFNLFSQKYYDINKHLLKVINVDTSFIPNKYGINETGRCVLYKSKNGNKVSAIIGETNVPIKISINKGSENDGKILEKDLSDLNIDISKIHKNQKKFILADAIYDTKNIREQIKKLGYTPIIDFNRRRTKDPIKLKKMKLKKKEIKIYKKRVKVEHFFAHLKGHNRILGYRYSKNLSNFVGFVFVSCIKMLAQKYYV